MRRRTCTVFSIHCHLSFGFLVVSVVARCFGPFYHHSVDFRIGRIVITNNVKCMYGVLDLRDIVSCSSFENMDILFRKNSHDAFD